MISRLALLSSLVALLPTSAAAMQPSGPAPTDRLELADRAPGLVLRRQPSVSTSRRAPLGRMTAWSRLQRDAGTSWRASWDQATGVPRQMWGEGIAAPGAVADADAAAAHARAFLARHIDLLAPGSSIDDFTLVSNVESGGLRVIGMVQHAGGIRVYGGQVSFRYKNDRLFVVSSQALPDVEIPPVTARVQPYAAEIVAGGWIASEAGNAQVSRVGEPMILPLIGADRVYGYRLVVPVTVEASDPIGRWQVYLDAASGERVARRQTLAFATGDILYNAPLRYPGGERADFPAADTAVVVDGTDLLTEADGAITWSGDAPGALITKTVGQFVDISNQAGDDDTALFTIAPDGQVVWDGRTDEQIDAQITAYIHTRIVKDYVRTFAPGLEFLDELQTVNVNIDDQCNAFSDGNTINFFRSSSQCENTARLADVVYHEYGHSVHTHSIIEGVGFFNGAHSEGLADYLAATITGDPAMGRGFFHTSAPLRHIDPIDKENRWPEDVAGVHYTGLIFAGAMWDLRKLLVQRLGEDDGVALANKLYYATLQRATDIPSTYIEVLAEDDDNGNLLDGTPDVCDINAAFGPHGLRSLDVSLTPLASELPSSEGHPVALSVNGLFPQCPGDQVSSVTLRWRRAGESDDAIQEIQLTESDGQYQGTIPEVPDGTTVEYQIDLKLSDLTELTFPDNPADTMYQFYVGETVQLYCTGFETDPFAEGWTHAMGEGSAPNADDWAWGAPAAPAVSGDPPAAFGGEFVIGNDLGADDGDGKYPSDAVSFAKSPVIDVDNYTDVHLQYWRWLNVEDGFYDHASILVNDQVAWTNLNSDMGPSSSIHHEDREWRFHDVPISEFTRDHAVQIAFQLESDSGLELGGWTIDELCVVANVNSVCGDGVITGAETCDDAGQNSDTAPDACRTSCRLATCGDGVLDSGEECDDGNLNALDECSSNCTIPGGDGGCGCQSGPGRGDAAAMGLILVLGLGLRRRRARARA